MDGDDPVDNSGSRGSPSFSDQAGEPARLQYGLHIDENQMVFNGDLTPDSHDMVEAAAYTSSHNAYSNSNTLQN